MKLVDVVTTALVGNISYQYSPLADNGEALMVAGLVALAFNAGQKLTRFSLDRAFLNASDVRAIKDDQQLWYRTNQFKAFTLAAAIITGGVSTAMATNHTLNNFIVDELEAASPQIGEPV